MEYIIIGFFLIIAAAIFAVWIGIIVDIIRSNFKDSNSKLIWLVMVIFLPFIGSILYFAIGQDQKALPEEYTTAWD